MSDQSLQERLRDMHWGAADSCDPEFNEALLEAAEAIDTLQRQLAERGAEIVSKSEQIGKLYRTCNERDVLLNLIAEAMRGLTDIACVAKIAEPCKPEHPRAVYEWIESRANEALAKLKAAGHTS